MSRITNFYATSIGKKFVVAVTGIILFGFVAGHMAGNLKVFTGSASNGVPHIDEYGQFLKDFGSPVLPQMLFLWVARLVLLASVVLHVVTVIRLSQQNAKARPIAYVRSEKRAATLSSQWMMVSGLVILVFIVFHILHFTTGTIQLGEKKFEHGQVYSNLHGSFSVWYVAIGYTAVMVMLAFHLYHGVWSLFQTLGLDSPDRNAMFRMIAIVFTLLVTVGFVLVPLSFLTGSMPTPAEYDHSLLTNH